jgi:hypothetical protein
MISSGIPPWRFDIDPVAANYKTAAAGQMPMPAGAPTPSQAPAPAPPQQQWTSTHDPMTNNTIHYPVGAEREVAPLVAGLQQQSVQGQQMARGLSNMGRKFAPMLEPQYERVNVSPAAAFAMTPDTLNGVYDRDMKREAMAQDQQQNNRRMSLAEKAQLAQQQQQAAEHADRLAYQKQVLKNQEDDHDIAVRRAALDEARAEREAKTPRVEAHPSMGGFSVINPDGSHSFERDPAMGAVLDAENAAKLAYYDRMGRGGGGGGGTGKYPPGPNGESSFWHTGIGGPAYVDKTTGTLMPLGGGSKAPGGANEKIRKEALAFAAKEKAAWTKANPDMPWTDYQEKDALNRYVEYVTATKPTDGFLPTAAPMGGSMTHLLLTPAAPAAPAVALPKNGDKRPAKGKNFTFDGTNWVED